MSIIKFRKVPELFPNRTVRTEQLWANVTTVVTKVPLVGTNTITATTGVPPEETTMTTEGTTTASGTTEILSQGTYTTTALLPIFTLLMQYKAVFSQSSSVSQ